jgi:hypothetical protein
VNCSVDLFHLLLCSLCQGYENCENWLDMQEKLSKKLSELYEEHGYVYEKLSGCRKNNFEQICSGVPKKAVMEDALVDLSRYLKNYHQNKCIVLIDEYDHPLNVAYRYQYYEQARSFFASLFGALLKVSTYFRLTLYDHANDDLTNDQCRTMTKI